MLQTKQKKERTVEIELTQPTVIGLGVVGGKGSVHTVSERLAKNLFQRKRAKIAGEEELAADLEGLTVEQLQKLAEDCEIDYKGMKKADLIAAIEAATEPA